MEFSINPQELKFNILSTTPPALPKRLPAFVKHTISKVPDYMRPAAANALFPPVASLMHDVTFRYVDNVIHEPTFMEGTIAGSGQGKGFLDPMYEAIIRRLREHDAESNQKLLQWQKLYKSKAGNAKKPERPQDAAILVPEPDMTNPALILLLQDAEREGNRSLYTPIPEIDLLDQCCGGHKKVTKVIRLNFDTKHYGAQRSTVDGITGNPFLRWKFNFSCVPERAQSFFKYSLTDGTLGRIGINYVPKPVGVRGIPRQGNYDESYLETLDEYLVRLTMANGEIKVPRLGKLIKKLDSELTDIAELADDDIFESFCHRSLCIAWLKGCVLYIAEGYTMTKDILNFVEWSLYYDLWSKVAIFAPQMKNSQSKIDLNNRQYGPANMLDMLPDTFSQTELENLRDSLGKPKYCISQLTIWQSRNYIKYDEESQLYTKTDNYLANHKSVPVKG